MINSPPGFPPIESLGFLSDGVVTALVAADASIEWMCIPRMDGPSVFGAILDRSAGHFRVGPVGGPVATSRRYLPGSLVLETTWDTAIGTLVLTDALTVDETGWPDACLVPNGSDDSGERGRRLARLVLALATRNARTVRLSPGTPVATPAAACDIHAASRRDAGRRQPPLGPAQVTRFAGDIHLIVARLL